MALVLSRAGPVKADIRLQQAIAAFQAELAPEQRTDFEEDLNRFRTIHPDENDVSVLMSVISRQKHRKNCFGPRFMNVLQSAQQFAAIGDILVGGSQNLIACGIWTAIRSTILILVNSDGNLEKLSHMFMVAGRSAPRYETISRLYHRKSKALLTYLHEYFIIMIKICHKLIKMSKKSRISRIFSLLDDSETKKFQSDLDYWANMIKEETQLLMAQGIEQQGSLISSALFERSKTEARRQKLKLNTQVLKACSSYDHQSSWKRTRKLGTTELYNQSNEYKTWKCDKIDQSSTLLYMGKLGCGKSVLMANMVEDLNDYVQHTKILVAYFFCQHDDDVSLLARTVLGSLAFQLLRNLPDLSSAAECTENNGLSDAESICGLLKASLPASFQAYFVLDGLDECSGEEREVLLREIRRIQDLFSLRVCVSFREEADNPHRLDSTPLARQERVRMPTNNPDIKRFICDELHRCINSGTLVMGDLELLVEITNTLMDCAQGMFLWVSLQILALCRGKTDEEIRQALKDLPKDLPETYRRILKNCEGDGGQYQMKVLQLVTVASHPLTIEDVREALAVVPGDLNWNPARLPNNMYSVLAHCGGLLTIDEENLGIRLVHQSVKSFLVDDFDDAIRPLFTLNDADMYMSGVLITYLSYAHFDKQLSTTKSSSIAPKSVPSAVFESVVTSDRLKKFASSYLKTRKKSQSSTADINRMLSNIKEQARSTMKQHTQLYAYASSFWVHHLYATTAPLGPTVVGLIHKLVEKLFLAGLHDELEGEEVLEWAGRTGKHDVAEILCRAEGLTKTDMVLWAIRKRYDEVFATYFQNDKLRIEKDKIYAEIVIGQPSLYMEGLVIRDANMSEVEIAHFMMIAIWMSHQDIFQRLQDRSINENKMTLFTHQILLWSLLGGRGDMFDSRNFRNRITKEDMLDAAALKSISDPGGFFRGVCNLRGDEVDVLLRREKHDMRFENLLNSTISTCLNLWAELPLVLYYGRSRKRHGARDGSRRNWDNSSTKGLKDFSLD
ncbi:Vegetative incompatibility HET-E-1-like protein [Cladobotryum mycophilum]|uniref:Vegetative incompatibility HET-E-1-like protein n=1 Tax=Cladobotryum mycophilum TaxID=491253 RepID=A0ABR0SIS8_9HYPO